MKIKTIKSKRLLPRSKFLLLAQDFDKNGEKCLWNQLRDSEPHDFPHGGLFDQQGRAKPVLHTLASIRRTHLK